MPLYTFDCLNCDEVVEMVVKYSERDAIYLHDRCGGKLKRRGVELFRPAKENYQCKAILANGAKIPGHFGKEAKRRRKQK